MPDPTAVTEKSELEQSKQLRAELLSLQQTFAEYNHLWTILEETVGELNKRVRRLELAKRVREENDAHPEV